MSDMQIETLFFVVLLTVEYGLHSIDFSFDCDRLDEAAIPGGHAYYSLPVTGHQFSHFCCPAIGEMESQPIGR